MKPPITSDCSLAPKLLFVDWLKILANEKQAVQFRSPIVLVCEQKRCSHMLGAYCSDHFPIQISLDKPLKQNTPLTEPRYRFDKTNDDLLHNTLKDSLTNIDTNITTQDELEELAVTLCDKLMKAVDTSTPKVYSRNDPKSPISQAILDLIKEKRRLRQL